MEREKGREIKGRKGRRRGRGWGEGGAESEGGDGATDRVSVAGAESEVTFSVRAIRRCAARLSALAAHATPSHQDSPHHLQGRTGAREVHGGDDGARTAPAGRLANVAGVGVGGGRLGGRGCSAREVRARMRARVEARGKEREQAERYRCRTPCGGARALPSAGTPRRRPRSRLGAPPPPLPAPQPPRPGCSASRPQACGTCTRSKPRVSVALHAYEACREWRCRRQGEGALTRGA